MVLGIQEVQQIVKGLAKRELENPEGAGVDLRLGEVHKIVGGQAYIEADTDQSLGKRAGFDTECIMKYRGDGGEEDYLTIAPGEFYLVKTIETVDIPQDVMGDLRPRSTMFRAGLHLLTGIAPPGYKGEMIYGLQNIGEFDVKLQLGSRISVAVFYRLEEPGVLYRGQNQHGRITVSGEETQV